MGRSETCLCYASLWEPQQTPTGGGLRVSTTGLSPSLWPCHGDLCVPLGIRQLQLILLKVALILGIEIHVNVEFQGLVQPPEDQENEREWEWTEEGMRAPSGWEQMIMGGARRTCRWFSALTKGALFMRPGLLRTFGLPKRPLAQCSAWRAFVLQKMQRLKRKRLCELLSKLSARGHPMFYYVNYFGLDLV